MIYRENKDAARIWRLSIPPPHSYQHNFNRKHRILAKHALTVQRTQTELKYQMPCFKCTILFSWLHNPRVFDFLKKILRSFVARQRIQSVLTLL